jgi:hypothetical protein
MRRREMRRAGGDDDEVETKVIPRRVDQSEKEMKRVRQELGKGGKDDSLTRSESVTQSLLKISRGKPDLGMKLIAPWMRLSIYTPNSRSAAVVVFRYQGLRFSSSPLCHETLPSFFFQ